VNNLALCESKSLREEQLKEVSQDRALEILGKAKALVMALHHGVGVATTEQIAEYFEVSTETISSLVKSHRKEFESDGLHVIQGKELLEHKSKLHLCSNDARLTIWNPRSALRCGMLLRDSEIAKQTRTVLLDVADQREAIEKLEQQFQPVQPIPTLKEINEAAKIFGNLYGLAYKQQYVQQKIAKFHPSLAGHSPDRKESASLTTAKALLTPTQIAEELGWLCKTGKRSGDAQRTNKLIEQLGYQIKIAGVWSATDKAIAANLVDRKPISTKSSSQKDQMLWSADIIPILQEHTTAQQTLNV
jgi:hypothetical protein